MDLSGCLRVRLAEHGVKDLGRPLSLPLSQGFQFPADRAAVLIFLKINIVQQGLYIKTGSAGNDRDAAAAVNLPQGLLRHLLEGDHVKGLLWLQHVNEIMGNAIHFPGSHLGRADIHVSVYLHGIRADDFPANGLCQPDGKGGLSHCRGSCEDNERLLHKSSFQTMRLNFFSSSYLLMEMMVGLP